MSNNQYGLDNDYFERKIAILHRDGLRNWRPDELARELARMSRTADKSVMLEPEFETQVELAALREELAGAKHDIASFLETMAKVCDLLGINTEDAKHAEGNPSDVFFSHATAMQQRLTAAEQRNAVLVELLGQARGMVNGASEGWHICVHNALKPTESGASE